MLLLRCGGWAIRAFPVCYSAHQSTTWRWADSPCKVTRQGLCVGNTFKGVSFCVPLTFTLMEQCLQIFVVYFQTPSLFLWFCRWRGGLLIFTFTWQVCTWLWSLR